MIALFAVLSLAAVPGGADHGLGKFQSPQDCGGGYAKANETERVGVRRLSELPDAHQEIAVNRLVGGCPVPIIVRYNVSR